jgi:tetratricopeptide (TPR) repeat protein
MRRPAAAPIPLRASGRYNARHAFAERENSMTKTMNSARLALVATGLSLAIAGAALAAGDAGGNAGGAGTDAQTQANSCPTGKVWDPNYKGLFTKGKCVDAADLKKDEKKDEKEKQGLIYDQGKALAKAGRFEDAIAMLKQAPDPTDPRVLNYLGFSSRKLGRMDEALAFYNAAVAANPDFSLVREYLGEAYIQLGQLEKAREQLSEIERICGGKACAEYADLAELIVKSQTN